MLFIRRKNNKTISSCVPELETVNFLLNSELETKNMNRKIHISQCSTLLCLNKPFLKWFCLFSLFGRGDIKIVIAPRNPKKWRKSYAWYLIILGKRTLEYTEFNGAAHLFCFRPEMPFLEKFGPKIQKTVSFNQNLVSTIPDKIFGIK